MENKSDNPSIAAITTILEQVEIIKKHVEKERDNTVFIMCSAVEVGQDKLSFAGGLIGESGRIKNTLLSMMNSEPELAMSLLEATLEFLSIKAHVLSIPASVGSALHDFMIQKEAAKKGGN